MKPFSAAALSLLLAACGQEAPPPAARAPETSAPAVPLTAAPAGRAAPSAAAAAPATRYEVAEVPDAGAIAGRVTWQGPRPRMPTLDVGRGREVCGDKQPFPALSVASDGAVADAVVSLTDVHRGRAPDLARGAVIDQTRCRYSPHVAATAVGSTMEFKNSDDILHNVHADWMAPDADRWFNVATPLQGMSIRKPVTREGVARIVCDAGHTWMLSYVHAFVHPYYAVTAQDGRYRIEGVPPGVHQLRLWHGPWRVTGDEGGRPLMGEPVVQAHEVTVPAGGEATLDLTLSDPPG